MLSRRRALCRVRITALFLATAAIAAARGGEFRPIAEALGDPRNAAQGVPGVRLSGNGQVVVGSCYSAAPGTFQAWRWTPTGGFEWLPLAAAQQQPYWMGCVATALSTDGAKIFVSCQFDEHHVVALRVDDIRAYRYEGGMFYALQRPHDESYVLDVTPSGALGVGYDLEVHHLEADAEYRPYRWDGATATELSWLAAGSCGSYDDDDALALAVSDNGTVMVGKSGETWNYVRPVVWINGAVSRLDLYGPECGGSSFYLNPVRDLSGDGRFAVGSWDLEWGGPPPLPAYWTIATRVRTLLPLPALHSSGVAYCITQDGGRIGGQCETSGGLKTGVLWNRSAGTVQTAADALAAAGVVAHQGWQLQSVEGVSADGKQIVGRGRHPNGQIWFWWADLRNPPANDACAGAEVLNPNHTPTFLHTWALARTGTTREATRDGTATCALSSAVNVWYKYTAPVAGFLELDLCDTPSLPDGYIAVHTGCPGTTLNEIACSTACPQIAGCGRPCLALPALELAPYVTYYIEVGGAAGYDFTLTHRFLPRNDECAQALAVGHNPSSTPGTTIGMQLDAAPTCQGVTVTAPGVWYTVIGTGTTMTAQTCNGTDYDTKLSVYCGGCGVQTCIGANDDTTGCGPQSRGSSVSWCSIAGALYHIFVHGYASYTGNFQLDVFDNGVPCQLATNCLPVNDTCTQAISASAGTQTGDNTNAQTDTPAASCAPSARDVWYRYVPRCDGQLWVDTCQSDGTLVDSVISLYDGCTGAELACNDDYNVPPTNCGTRSVAIASVVQDQEVAIRVAGYGSGGTHQGTFPLRITEVAAPLVVYGGAMPDAWAAAPYSYQVQYYGSCGRRFTSATGLPPGLNVDLWTGLISGTPIAPGDYVIHVTVTNNDIVNPEWAEADLTLRVLPINNLCSYPLHISEGLHYFGTVGASTDGPAEPGCFPSDPQIHADVWFRYTASCTGPATIDLCDSNYDSKVAVYFGANCPTTGGTALACNDDACGLQSRVSFFVSAGVTYLIRIGGYMGAQGQGRMLLTCFNDCNNNGVNDAEEIASGAAGDCNHNNRPDYCDPPGDMSGDGLVSPADWPYWAACLRGPGVWYADDCCGLADFDFDNDVDVHDVWRWMQAVSP